MVSAAFYEENDIVYEEELLPAREYPRLEERRAAWHKYSKQKQRTEMLKCALDCEYFISEYASIYDNVTLLWIPFDLWVEQLEVLHLIDENDKVAILKARQLGLSWLALGYIVWSMIFNPITEALVFSKTEREAAKLISLERLRGMYNALPRWMQAETVTVDKYTEFRISNGSGVMAFPSNAGDSYTATIALIDEADLIPNLSDLLTRVEPTVEAGGKLILISKSNKANTASPFKNTFISAWEGKSDYKAAFLAWNVHPARNKEWYNRLRQRHMEREGHLDTFYENYPATVAEAIAPYSSSKRIAYAWLKRANDELPPLYIVGSPAFDDSPYPAGLPEIPGLVIYEKPRPNFTYTIGIDSAEGKVKSNDTSLSILENETMTEVAHLSGVIEPDTTADYADQIGHYYNDAAVMPERNNHGGIIISRMKANSTLTLLTGLDGFEGWLSNPRGKAVLYNTLANMFRTLGITVRHPKTITQIGSIERSTLRAPGNDPDDAADSLALGVVGVLHGAIIESGYGGLLRP